MSSAANKIAIMLEMQHAMNTKVHEQWFEQGFEWYRAIWVECAEMLDHYGWKWWKKQTPDTEQVILELVDIFHFGLSLRIDGHTSFAELAAQIEQEMQSPIQGADFKVSLETLAASAVADKAFNAAAFAGCMQQIGMNIDDLYRGYVGKNTLNFFRQDHGYKDGTYIKVWHGQEDNEHLVAVVKSLDTDNPDFAKLVYQGLQQRYPS
ncbi:MULTISPECIES: dUTP diphosphatase [Pseudoalteromonas]|uniref:dUTP diphosphatase n=1 Tax=Pseudoalteromonas ruthenica TaxID=151081 RepID=A0A0F4PJ10_9GAMM|nr:MULTISPECIES: dUTP diphosphatase [Pseudoalteromonas]KJY95397.1 dUTP diphosphatase [Pseudoalteromonas ruthenica]KJY96989.1 dUTP diphosphatase [Pseudoalteromonas ruthenica]MCF2863895.1 dUTP diphosphatase [Pseudoalteromonas sp. CNAT2-18]MCG7559816.1 dUTP diphosphatase [Pseudoalteromonas sp. CNAT2-18.1]MCG7568113.1 dUTP diphosphatase [Pseudoalteromonas sp. CnMc7-15]